MLYRGERLNKFIRETLGQIINKKLEFGALVTITTVEVDDKIERAKIGFSAIPSKESPRVLKILNDKSGWLRSLLNGKIKIRSIPQLVFQIDYGPEKAAEIEKAFIKKAT